MKDITKIGELQTQISRRLDNLFKLREMVVVNHHPRKVLINRMQSEVYAVMYALVLAFLITIGYKYD
jgi:hypothetical protein